MNEFVTKTSTVTGVRVGKSENGAPYFYVGLANGDRWFPGRLHNLNNAVGYALTPDCFPVLSGSVLTYDYSEVKAGQNFAWYRGGEDADTPAVQDMVVINPVGNVQLPIDAINYISSRCDSIVSADVWAALMELDEPDDADDIKPDANETVDDAAETASDPAATSTDTKKTTKVKSKVSANADDGEPF